MLVIIDEAREELMEQRGGIWCDMGTWLPVLLVAVVPVAFDETTSGIFSGEALLVGVGRS